MNKRLKVFVKFLTIGAILFGSVLSVSAYNGKFSYNLESGWFSPWAYSSYATKYSVDENPVVQCTYTTGSTDNFEYTVRNSNDQDRVVRFTQSGTFGLRAFERNTTVQNHMYKLGVKRVGGSWNSSASVQGLWNIDSY